MTKSASAVPGPAAGEGHVSTVKMLGSGWSKLTVLMTLKRARSYLYGERLPCQATTLKGEWRMRAEKRRPPNLLRVDRRTGRRAAAVGA